LKIIVRRCEMVRMKMQLTILLVCALGTSLANADEKADAALRDTAKSAMRKAAEYYRGRVAYRGGYVYYYSPDLKQRYGEGVATPTQIWVQPPGTPTVGLAFLAAYRATGEQLYLDAAREAGKALLYGQLKSGGWQNSVDFDPRGRVNQYRNGKGGGANNSTLDDGITQTAIQFMARLDQALGFKDAAVHESATIALDALLKAQFANGAFPQVWTGPVESVQSRRASYPDYDWRTEGRVKNYWDMYTLNDGLAVTVLQTLVTAADVYNEERYKSAIRGLGDFLVLAQMPEPQPAWAQQYSREMQPIWARRFEPAAVTGGESQGVLETLLKIHRLTGEAKYLEPIPRALAYLNRSRLADGRLARYYELKTNRPLYMTRQGDEYSLTYDDTRLPDHYGWKINSRLDEITAEYETALAGRPAVATSKSSELSQRVRDIIRDQDDQARWISVFAGEPLAGQPKFKPGDRYLNSAVFSRNLETLSEFIEGARSR